MNLIDRAKNIIVAPKKEWEAIDAENTPHAKVATGYLMWLALIPAAAIFIGWGLIGQKVLGIHVSGTIGLGLRQAIMQFVSILGGAYLTAFVFDMLAPSFGSQKNFNKAFSLTAYCYTPVCIGGIFYIHWSLTFLAGLISLYALYLLYIGLKPMMKTPDDKVTGYFVVSLVVMVVVSIALSFILGAILGIRGGFF